MANKASSYFERRGFQPVVRERVLTLIEDEREPSMASRAGRPISPLAGHDSERVQKAKRMSCGTEYDWVSS